MVDFKELENSYNFGLPEKCTVVIRADGKNFSKLLKEFGPKDQGHAEAMLVAAIETIKLTQNFVIAFVQSDEISIILSNEDSEKAQAWFSNRIQKITTVVSSSMSVSYSNYMSSVKSKLFVGLFDARAFNIDIADISNYIISRVKNGYANMVSKVYRYEFGSIKNKRLDEMEAELIDNNFYIDNIYKFGSVIIKDDRGYSVINVSDVYNSFDEFINQVLLSIEQRRNEIKVPSLQEVIQ